MGIAERNAQKDTIDKYLRRIWGDYPRVDTSRFSGEEIRDKVKAFVGYIVYRAQEDGIELNPADVARRAADHLAGRDRPGVHWRIMDDYGRDLEQEDTQSPPCKGDVVD